MKLERKQLLVAFYIFSNKFVFGVANFYAPGQKGPPGASINQIVRLYLEFKARKAKNFWLLSNRSIHTCKR